ncbi:MAG: hypothetical protein R2852_07670 [Bacteroidia bacterium]
MQAKDVVTVNNPVISEGRLKVLNAVGQILIDQEFNNSTDINVKDFNMGVYTIIIGKQFHIKCEIKTQVLIIKIFWSKRQPSIGLLLYSKQLWCA